MFRQRIPKPVQDIVDAIKSHFKSYTVTPGLTMYDFLFRGTLSTGEFLLWISHRGVITDYAFKSGNFYAYAHELSPRRYEYGIKNVTEVRTSRSSTWVDAIFEGDIEALKQFIVDLEQNGIEAFIRRIKEAIG